MKTLGKIFRCHDISIHRKIKTIQVMVFSVTALWKWKLHFEETRKNIDAFECWYRWIFLRVPWITQENKHMDHKTAQSEFSLEVQITGLKLSSAEVLVMELLSSWKSIVIRLLEKCKTQAIGMSIAARWFSCCKWETPFIVPSCSFKMNYLLLAFLFSI